MFQYGGYPRFRLQQLERLSANDDEIRRIVTAEVAAEIREAILEIFRSIKTMLIESFDECYVAITESAGAATTTTVVAMRP